MSGVRELSGPLYGPSFTASDINFFSWAGHIPCLQLFSAGISQLWLLQNLRVATVTQVSFSHFTQGPLTAASPFWAVTQGFRCHVLPGLSGSQKPQNKNPRPLHSSSFTTLNPTPRVNIAKVPLPSWDEHLLSWMTVAAISLHSFFLGQKAL